MINCITIRRCDPVELLAVYTRVTRIAGAVRTATVAIRARAGTANNVSGEGDGCEWGRIV